VAPIALAAPAGPAAQAAAMVPPGVPPAAVPAGPPLLAPPAPALPPVVALPQLVRPNAGTVRVALLLPLSGPEQPLGQALLNAGLMALHEVGNERLVLLPRDTQGTPEGARAAATAALQEGAELILGPVFSAEVAAVAPIARARGVNVVAFSTDTAVAGNGVFLTGFVPQQQVDRIAAYAASRGMRRFAALAPQSAYGTAVVQQLRFAAQQLGGELIDVSFYPPSAQDVMEQVRALARYQVRRNRLIAQRRVLEARNDADARAQLQQLAGLDTLGGPGYDALLIAEGGAELRQIAPLLPFFDIDPRQVRFLGTGLWDDPTIGQEPSLIGGWYAAPPPETTTALMERFQALYGYRPVRIATLAYDAVALAAALGRSNGAADYSRAALTNPSGFAGTDGIFRFGANGVAERGLAVLEVTARGPRVIDRAATTFVPLTN
jgi:ABC-type branched-subunit amino acid transport system substrate-binding protein